MFTPRLSHRSITAIDLRVLGAGVALDRDGHLRIAGFRRLELGLQLREAHPDAVDQHGAGRVTCTTFNSCCSVIGLFDGLGIEMLNPWIDAVVIRMNTTNST